ncbi:MAG: GNAT family N-acetyltransferase [Candidatus Rokuibacteriota bacterium]
MWRRARLRAFPDLEARMGYTVEQDHHHFRTVIAARNALWVAEVNGRPVGFMAIAGDFIDQLFVDHEHQRRGFGSALITQAKRLSPGGLRLFTFQNNGAGRTFYEKHDLKAVRFGVSAAPESEPDVEYHWMP